ncbi:MAG TPA: hypothetical protein VKZ18_17790 [Polyangia bacterium]|nr:hypothetical protein [Polyangia bacterium]
MTTSRTRPGAIALAAAEALPPSHPLTPRHVRLLRENALIGGLDVNDGAGLRRLLDEYRREFPDDPSQLQAGYAVIADCLQHPGPAASSAGRPYAEVEAGSILRRFVLRACLGEE